ncbi:RraA family protein [Streptomyces sp. NBC_01264]|uniref:RraA family protein n=1 Tax=Streptomyces sp. NBC_01264 TaxID=2903804 RepID=UPI00225A2A26|nr:RraA family protein [Streptomyces sp. NBC_01264]MCX4778470.1 RraA family protein [Streptomyces sp. NBC_01264]
MSTPDEQRIAEIRADFAGFGCAQLRDAAPKYVEVVAWPLQRRTPVTHLAGPAFPVATDNDMLPVLQGLDATPPGHVLLVTNTAPRSEALAGDILATAAVAQGLGGLVVNGAVRDVGYLRGLDLAVYSTEVDIISAKTALVPAAQLPMEVTVPIVDESGSVDATIEVGAGDWVFGDEDAVVLVRARHLSAVFSAARILQGQEEQLREALRGGHRLSEVCGLHDYIAGTGPLRMDV